MSQCQAINELISGYLDDELTQSDYQKVDVHLRSCVECQKTLEQLRTLRGAVAKSQTNMDLQEERWESIMNDLPAKNSRRIGWILLIAGILTLVSFGVWEFAVDTETPLAIKLGVAAVWFGFLFLFLSVLRQRLVSWKTDKYKDVKY